VTLLPTSLRARLAATIAALLLGAGAGALPALANDDGGRDGDQAAVAVNTKDGSTLFRFAFSIRRIAGEIVDQSNVALAYAQCSECRTVAISVQVLLVEGSPDQVTPTNLAVALNEGCTECQTLAAAYQFVFGAGEELRFTADGRRQIAAIRQRFRELGRSDLGTEEIQRQADALADELRTVLREEVTRAPRQEDRDVDDAGQRQDGDAGTGAADSAPAQTSTTPPGRTTPAQTSTTPPGRTTPAQTSTTPPAEATPTQTSTTPSTQTSTQPDPQPTQPETTPAQP
jgi:putative peptide zinc metalloprotease protein